MSVYSIKLERLQTINTTIDAKSPDQAVNNIKNYLNQFDWDKSDTDQITACCPDSGDGSYKIIQKK